VLQHWFVLETDLIGGGGGGRELELSGGGGGRELELSQPLHPSLSSAAAIPNDNITSINRSCLHFAGRFTI